MKNKTIILVIIFMISIFAVNSCRKENEEQPAATNRVVYNDIKDKYIVINYAQNTSIIYFLDESYASIGGQNCIYRDNGDSTFDLLETDNNPFLKLKFEKNAERKTSLQSVVGVVTISEFGLYNTADAMNFANNKFKEIDGNRYLIFSNFKVILSDDHNAIPNKDFTRYNQNMLWTAPGVGTGISIPSTGKWNNVNGPFIIFTESGTGKKAYFKP